MMGERKRAYENGCDQLAHKTHSKHTHCAAYPPGLGVNSKVQEEEEEEGEEGREQPKEKKKY